MGYVFVCVRINALYKFPTLFILNVFMHQDIFVLEYYQDNLFFVTHTQESETQKDVMKTTFTTYVQEEVLDRCW